MNASDYSERLKTTGRNDPCPCGSGRKYKQCHLAEDEAARHEELAKAAEEREAALAAEAKNTDDSNDGDSAKKNPRRREDHHRDGKASHGQDRKTNIPRRGAV